MQRVVRSSATAAPIGLTMKVREAGRVVNVACLVATWVNAPLSSYPVPPASMFLETTSSVFCSSAVGLNSTTSVPAYSVGRCPGGA